MNENFLAVVIVGNVFTFVLMGLDKYYAIRGKWRIRERALLFSAAIFGGIGAFLGMLMFRHKTKKMKFKVLLPLIAALHFFLIYIWYNESCN